MQIDTATQQNLDLWLNTKLDPETRKELNRLLKEEPEKIQEGFYTKLSFGTGGLRGVMGIGTNRMNLYTIGMATQGLAHYLLQIPGKLRVFISYDCRRFSRLFAEHAAKVLAGNGIEAVLAKELRPTPYVSFNCRRLRCSAAIMITASHNPPEYNGFKVYWSDGGQVLPPHDSGILKEIDGITSLNQVKTAPSLSHPLIKEVLEDADRAYLDAVNGEQLTAAVNKKNGDQLHIVYSNLHGSGITLIPKALKEWGFTRLTTVKEQDAPDGNFPTVETPNPEEKSALKMGIENMRALNADLLIATDPDADRVGVAVQQHGQARILNGNQIGCLLLEHICRSLPKPPPNAAFVKTIGTTELFKEIAEFYKCSCVEVLTGFKYIAEKIEQWEHAPDSPQFIFGAEESYGYLLGTYARDKDAVIASALIAEAALEAKLEGKTLIDRLHDIWKIHGIHVEKLASLNFPETQEGHEQMKKGMQRLEEAPPKKMCGLAVVSLENYRSSIKTDMITGKQEPLRLPKSPVLRGWLEDGSKFMARPSGTEPKVKFYCGVKAKAFRSIEEGERALEAHADALLDELKSLFKISEM